MAPARLPWRWALTSSLIAAACGGAPVAPSPQPSTPAQVILTAGPYDLSVFTVNSGNIWLCFGTSPSPVDASISLEMQLEPADTGWIARTDAGDLTLELAPSGGGVAGIMRGSADTSDGQGIRIQGTDGRDAQVSGLREPSGDVSGGISGGVVFVTGPGWFSCSENRWRLSARAGQT